MMDQTDHEHSHAPASRPNLVGLRVALGITISMMVVECVGSYYSHSLALLADAGHMAGDSMALLLTFLAFRISQQPVSRTKTYGYYRMEILAAFINGLALWVVVLFVLYHAVQRFLDPPAIRPLAMMFVALAGLVANGICGWLLYRTRGDNLNLQGAFLHVSADALSSLGVLVASVIMWCTNWRLADPIASVFVCVVIMFGSWRLITQSVNVLLEGTPAHINVQALKQAMQDVPGVTAVHDVHVWTITSGMDAMSGHINVQDLADGHRILQQLEKVLHETFSIAHTTFQLEPTQHTS